MFFVLSCPNFCDILWKQKKNTFFLIFIIFLGADACDMDAEEFTRAVQDLGMEVIGTFTPWFTEKFPVKLELC